MCVQPNALGRKAIQYMVLYCLTPPLFHRYSCLNLCLPNPAGGGRMVQPWLTNFNFVCEGSLLVNSALPWGKAACGGGSNLWQRTRKMGHPVHGALSDYGHAGSFWHR